MEKEQFTLGRIDIPNKTTDAYPLQEEFEGMASSYSKISDLDGLVQEALTGNSNILTSVRYDEELVNNYSRHYRSYVSSFYSLFCDPPIIEFSNVDFEGFVQKAQSIGYLRRKKTHTTAMVMQFVAVTSQIAEFLNQIYEAATHKAPAYKYMEIGARLLDYTDRKMFRKMYNVMRKINDPSVARCIVDVSLKNEFLVDYPFPHSHQYYGERTAMADYSYTFSARHYPKIPIAPVKLHNSALCSEYNTANCSLIFGLGLQAALFEVPQKNDFTVLSFAGTQPFGGRTLNNVFTDLCQIQHGPETTYLAAVGILSELAKAVKGQIKVVGHSLGGGLMQYACAAIDDIRIAGTGFNSAGLSSYSCYTLTGERIHRNKGRIEHICASTDPVSKVGKLIGTVGHVDTHTYKPFSHSMDDLNEKLNRGKISCYKQ